MSPQGSPDTRGGQARGAFVPTVADCFTFLRIPLAVLFVLFPTEAWRLAIVLTAGLSDLLDGLLARRYGSSRLGVVLDPVADKLFMAATFTVVALSRELTLYEVAGVLVRDAVATVAFVVTAVSGRPTTIPARIGGKAVTLGQVLTLLAFVADSPLLRPIAWATSAIALYAIWDYSRAAPAAGRPVGQ